MKIKAFVLSLLAAVAFLPLVSVEAQNVQTVQTNITSDTAGSVALLVKYIGTSTSATTDVAVAAGGDMTFRIAGSADTAVNTVAQGSLCGATPGTLDLSTPDAGCNSLGEMVDVINASGDWIAVLVGGLRTDLTDNTLASRSVTTGVTSVGVPLYFDSTVSLYASGTLQPTGCDTNIRCFVTPSNKILENPFGGTQTVVRFMEGFSTYNTTSNFKLYSVKASNKLTGGSETVTEIYSAVAAATGTNAVAVALTAAPVQGRPHEKVIARIVDTSTSSAFTLHVTGERRSVN